MTDYYYYYYDYNYELRANETEKKSALRNVPGLFNNMISLVL